MQQLLRLRSMERSDADTHHYSDEVFRQVTHVLSDAYGTISSEVRLELDSEVSESLRHEFSQHSWTDRLHGSVTLHLENTELLSISGHVLNSSETHAELLTNLDTCLVWLDQVTHIENLSRKISRSVRSELSSHFHIHWLHDMCDAHIQVTVWCGRSRRLVGNLITVGNDYLELLVNERPITINTGTIQCVSAPSYGVAL